MHAGVRRCAALVLLLFSSSCSPPKTSTIEAKLVPGASLVDFGLARPGATAAAQLALKSASTVAVSISSVSVEDDPAAPGGKAAFAIATAPTEIAGLGSEQLTLRFAPSSEGDLKARLVIASNDPDSPAIVALKGRGANPRLQLVPECRAPCTAFTATADPPSVDFGARRPLRHKPDGSVVDEPAWPTVTLLNAGELPVTVASITLTGDKAFFAQESIDATDFPIGAGSGQAVHLGFDPSMAPSYAGQLEVVSDDPRAPKLTVALAGTLAPAQPPTACAAIVEAQGPDGSVSYPRDASGNKDFHGTPPPVQPGDGARVTFAAFSDYFAAAADPNSCTTSPETGRDGLLLKWTLEERPAESSAALKGDTSPTPTFVPDAIGHYRVRLTATAPDGQPATADVSFDAFLRRDLVAQLTWPEAGVDLDLHLVRPGADCGGSCVFDPAADINGWSVTRTASFDWGKPGPGDDPRLDRDDQGTQGGVETVSLDHPEDDPACNGGSCTFGLYVHYFADGRAGSSQGSSCSGCSEGDACGCAALTSCVATHCVSPAHPRLAVYVKPDAASKPVLFPVPPADLAVAGPCFLWHVADVVWKVSGTAEVVEAGSAGKPELSYYGKMAPGSFVCGPNTDPGLPSGYEPGTVPQYP